MLYVGIDPSYSKTGIVYLDTETKQFIFKAVVPAGSNDSYLASLERSAIIVRTLIRDITYMNKVTSVIMEEPMMTSQMASRLGILSGILVFSLFMIPNIREVHSLNPVVVASMNKYLPYKKEFGKKQLSSKVASLLLDYLVSEEGYSIQVFNEKTKKDGSMKERKMSHDEAEAFLILMRLLMHKNYFESRVCSKLYKIHKGLSKAYQVNELRSDLIDDNR